MRLHWLAASLLLATAGCSNDDDDGSCGGFASCAYANTEWSAKACDCVPVPAGKADFWLYFAGDYDWAEYHPTLKDAVASSDATLLGKIASVSPGFVLEGDASGDVYTEVDVTVEVLDPIRGDALSTQSLQLTLSPNQRVSEELVASMNASLPKSPVLLILRRRESGKYRVVNGYGLWTKSIRGPVGAPLLAKDDLALVDAEISGQQTVEQLAESLK